MRTTFSGCPRCFSPFAQPLMGFCNEKPWFVDVAEAATVLVATAANLRTASWPMRCCRAGFRPSSDRVQRLRFNSPRIIASYAPG